MSSLYLYIILNDVSAIVLELWCPNSYRTDKFDSIIGSILFIRTCFSRYDNYLYWFVLNSYSSRFYKGVITHEINSKASSTFSYPSTLITKKADSKILINAFFIVFILCLGAALNSYKYILGVYCLIIISEKSDSSYFYNAPL